MCLKIQPERLTAENQNCLTLPTRPLKHAPACKDIVLKRAYFARADQIDNNAETIQSRENFGEKTMADGLAV
jgi:hypothetical protein